MEQVGIWNKSGKHPLPSAILKIYIPIDSSSLTEYTIFLFGRAPLTPYVASNFEKFTENNENTVHINKYKNDGYTERSTNRFIKL